MQTAGRSLYGGADQESLCSVKKGIFKQTKLQLQFEEMQKETEPYNVPALHP